NAGGANAGGANAGGANAGGANAGGANAGGANAGGANAGGANADRTSAAGANVDEAALAARVERVRAALAPSPCVLVSGPASLRAAVDPWGTVAAPQLELMRRVKERFDPERRCNPGLFVGGL
ncbi:FAD-linked oxidase C-terminal domain-containing protein, partial [Conexibacter arvalis]